MSNSEDPKVTKTEEKPKLTGSLGQQILVAVLVVAVGVLFGMGPVLETLRQPTAGETQAGIDVADIQRHARTASRLQALLNPTYSREGEIFVMGNDINATSQEMLYARLAEQEGLSPNKDDLDEFFANWQQTVVPNTTTTYGTALAQAKGTNNAIDAGSVLTFLQTRLAASAFRERHIAIPVPPQVIGDTLAQAMQQSVIVNSVTLDSAQLITDEQLAEIAADEINVQAIYDDLSTRFYQTPNQRTLNLYAADHLNIAKQVKVEDAALQERYESLKASRFTSIQVGEDDKETTTVQAFEDVVAELREEMSAEIAAELAAVLAQKFRTALMESGLANEPEVSAEALAEVAQNVSITPEDDPRLIQAVPLVITEGVVLDQPAAGVTNTSLGDYGQLSISDVNIFTDEVQAGYLVAPYRPVLPGNDRSESHVAMLVTATKAAGYRPLTEVKDEVVRWIAARNQYEALLAEGNALVAQAKEKGLETVFKEDEALRTKWNVNNPTTTTLRALEGIHNPAERLDDPLPAEQSAIALGAGIDPVQLTVLDNSQSTSAWDERPQFRIVELNGTETPEVEEFQAYYMGLQTRNQIFSSIGRQLETSFASYINDQIAEQ